MRRRTSVFRCRCAEAQVGPFARPETGPGIWWLRASTRPNDVSPLSCAPHSAGCHRAPIRCCLGSGCARFPAVTPCGRRTGDARRQGRGAEHSQTPAPGSLCTASLGDRLVLVGGGAQERDDSATEGHPQNSLRRRCSHRVLCEPAGDLRRCRLPGRPGASGAIRCGPELALSRPSRGDLNPSPACAGTRIGCRSWPGLRHPRRSGPPPPPSDLHRRDSSRTVRNPPPNMILKTPVSMEEHRTLLRSTGLVVVPTHDLAYPTGRSVLPEAMACGRPAAVTGTDGMTDYIRDGEYNLRLPLAEARGVARVIGDDLGGCGDSSHATGPSRKWRSRGSCPCTLSWQRTMRCTSIPTARDCRSTSHPSTPLSSTPWPSSITAHVSWTCVVHASTLGSSRATSPGRAPSSGTIDTQRFDDHAPVHDVVRRAVFLSNRQGRARPTVEEACRLAGVELTIIGCETAVPDPETAINQADLVFGIGRSAREGLACGRRVIAFDLLGCKGLVTRSNIDWMRCDRFAGYVDSWWPEPEELAQMIGTAEPLSLRDLIVRDHSPEAVADAYLQLADQIPRTRRLRALAVRRGPRVLSSSRISALLADLRHGRLDRVVQEVTGPPRAPYSHGLEPSPQP